MTTYRTNHTKPTGKLVVAGKAQCYHTDLKLIYMLPIMSYATSQQFRVDNHFKSTRNNRTIFTKLPRPLAKDRKNTLAKSWVVTYLASFSVTYLATSLKLAKFSITECTAVKPPPEAYQPQFFTGQMPFLPTVSKHWRNYNNKSSNSDRQ